MVEDLRLIRVLFCRYQMLVKARSQVSKLLETYVVVEEEVMVAMPFHRELKITALLIMIA